MENVVLSPVPLDAIEGIIAKAIRRELVEAMKAEQAPDPDELLTRKEAAGYLGISLPTLHDYSQRGIVTAYRLGTRVRYRRSDLYNALHKVEAAKYRAA